MAAFAAIILFLYSLQGFSRELQIVGGEKLKVWLGKVTSNRWVGFLIGAAATAIVQSSTAVISLAVSLVDTSVISFRSSLAIMLGANLGTTSTAWVVSFNLMGIGPFFIVLGAVVSMLPWKKKVFGKAVFYFGFVLVTLTLVSDMLAPLRDNPVFMEYLLMSATPWKGVLAGLVFTAIIQSSTVTTGLGILLVLQGILPAEAAIFLVIGANAGTTSTALVASMGMQHTARASAITNSLFNVVGVLLFFPFLRPFAEFVLQLAGDPGQGVALAHLMFNVVITLIYLSTLNWWAPALQKKFRV
ncbi:MAG: Na/Pi symporter [Syntrophobacterales bacterium]|nr:Na/Pi symporter [Syntrophobacterales bacterium]